MTEEEIKQLDIKVRAFHFWLPKVAFLVLVATFLIPLFKEGDAKELPFQLLMAIFFAFSISLRLPIIAKPFLMLCPKLPNTVSCR